MFKPTELPLSPETSHLSLSFRNIRDEESAIEFKKRVDANKGKILLVVHPFFAFEHNNWGESLQNPSSEEMDVRHIEYLDKLRALITKAEEQNVPILVMQGLPQRIPRRWQRYEHEKISDQALVDRYRNLGFKGDVFVAYTNFNDPQPYSMESGFEDLVAGVGIKKAVVAGSNFYGDPEKYKSYLIREYQDYDILTGKDKDHTIRQIDPDGCVYAAAMMFSFAGVEIGFTDKTFPEIIPKREALVPEKFSKTRLIDTSTDN